MLIFEKESVKFKTINPITLGPGDLNFCFFKWTILYQTIIVPQNALFLSAEFQAVAFWVNPPPHLTSILTYILTYIQESPPKAHTSD